MKKDHIPQDPSPLDHFTRELTYALDEQGRYTTGLSRGWEVKASALGVAWEDIQARIANAKAQVLAGEASPLLFFMELRLMDVGIVAAYTGFWKWQVKRHLKPRVFRRLPDKKLARYAELFEVSIEELKQMA
ncbi:MAG: hypothetical protein D6730_18255 [Bacteroidetes bacterium]|nr:MAG: hypothetical protein D6730_18255 [Bacteroidota bacterium]